MWGNVWGNFYVETLFKHVRTVISEIAAPQTSTSAGKEAETLTIPQVIKLSTEGPLWYENPYPTLILASRFRYESFEK